MCALEFKGIDAAGFGGFSMTDQILYNLKFFIDWGFLHHGAYNFYLFDADSFFTNDEAVLRAWLADPRYPVNTVFNGIGKEWVWESGVSVASGIIPPFRVSGVYVNGSFFPSSDTGPHRHHIDYRNGRVIFDESQNPNDEIRADYTVRGVYIGFADTEEFQLLRLDAVEEFLTQTVPSGTPNKDHQVWLPAVFIEVQSGSGRGLQLGGGQIKTRTIVLHIFADNAADRNLIMDWLDFQNRTAFWLADLNKIIFPFDQYGDVTETGATNWIDLMNTYPWRKLRIQEGTCKTINSLNTKLFRGQVRWNVEIDLGGI